MISSYGKVWALSGSNGRIFDGEVIVQEKADGCFSASTLVLLADGTKKKIKDMVEEKYEGYVKCFDFASQTYVNGKVLNLFKHPRNGKQLLTIKLNGRNTASRNMITCTQNHKIWTQRGYIEAKDLTTDDYVQSYNECLSPLQEQLLIGTLLGDGNLSRAKNGNPRFSIGHSIGHEQYHASIVSFLGPLFSRCDIRRGGFENSGQLERIHSYSSYALNEIYAGFYKNREKKSIDYEFLLKRMSPLSLAFWYMDDGSCTFPSTQRPRPIFHTQGFTPEDCEILKKILDEKFSFKSSVNITNKGPILQISAISQELFFALVAPFISNDYKYKLPERYREVPCVLNSYKYEAEVPAFVWQKIKEIIPAKYHGSLYDIETEYNNYLVSSTSILVHNSQLNFAKINGQLEVRSRSKLLDLNAPEKMFIPAIEYLQSVLPKLKEGWIYRGEYLNRPKHNVLTYGRIPTNYIMLFDVEIPDGELTRRYANRYELVQAAVQLDVDVVPELWRGLGHEFSEEKMNELLQLESYLGGPTIEGIVIKNYSLRDTMDGSLMKVKYVRESFKEQHRKEWKQLAPKSKDIIEQIAGGFKQEVIWQKAIQHLAEAGVLTDSPKDIGLLMNEIKKDFGTEHKEEVQKKLWKWALPQIERQLVRHFPEWYKARLMGDAFQQVDATVELERKG